jgi:hypothetical protein
MAGWPAVKEKAVAPSGNGLFFLMIQHAVAQ